MLTSDKIIALHPDIEVALNISDLDVIADALTYAAALVKDNAARVEAFRIVREINALSESLRVKKG